jgi:hypothetical protein
MAALQLSWKLFRVACIFQMILIALRLMITISDLFSSPFILYTIIKVIIYTLVFVFIYLGLSILNYNYPDIPLTVRQKRSFNWLFIINVLLITFLFAEVVITWDSLAMLLREYIHVNRTIFFYFILPFSSAAIIFALHLIFLGGMFRLRRAIYQNTITGWYNQFNENKPE